MVAYQFEFLNPLSLQILLIERKQWANIFIHWLLCQKKSLVSTQLASKMKCAYSYMLYDIRSLNWEDDATTIKNMAKAPLEHLFGRIGSNLTYVELRFLRLSGTEQSSLFVSYFMMEEVHPKSCTERCWGYA